MIKEKIEKIRLAVQNGNIRYRQHAVEMMIEREIEKDYKTRRKK